MEHMKERIDRWATAINAVVSLPIIGYILKDMFNKIGEKGAERLGKKVEKILGMDIEKAKYDIADEILYSVAVYKLTEKFTEEIDLFEERLRREEPKKAEAFVLYVAKTIKQFERNVKETIAPKKKEYGPRVEQEYKKLEEGIENAKKFLEALLKKTGPDADATFKARIAFLESKNVFSLIPPEKGPAPAVEVAKKFVIKTAEIGKNVVEQQKVNLADLEEKSKGFREKAREFRQKRGR